MRREGLQGQKGRRGDLDVESVGKGGETTPVLRLGTVWEASRICAQLLGLSLPPKQQEEWLAPSGPPHQEQQSRPRAWCRGDRPLLHFHAACPAVQNCAGTQRKERGRNPQTKATCPVSPSRARSQMRAQVSWLDSLAPLSLVGLGPEGHCPVATFLPH